MKILLVEDSPEVSLITVEYLTELGHQVVAVGTAELALQETPDGFDTVMTDVSLPGMSGIDLAKVLLHSRPHLPVIIASGYGTLNLESLLGEHQQQVFVLSKPYDMATLEATLLAAATVQSAARR